MKAVLVVDIPDYIDDISKVELAYGLYFRKRFDGESIDPTDILEHHEVYPLRPLPRKLTEADISWGEQRGYRGGWNDCLDEILGETE